ncbi:MAG: NAD(P)/FAD-dependent oxidoreductase, partial [Thermoplasmata archaeon]|nr:NAD(P)/FAD-dependent oxidoreductase [Thermoplasmata archaeon]
MSSKQPSSPSSLQSTSGSWDDEFDMLVVGCGPAGGMTALAASREGARVLVVERKKVIGYPVRCGEGTMRGILAYFGLEEGRWIAGDIEMIHFHPPKGKPALFRGDRLGAVMLDRTLFEQEIARRAEEEGTEVWLERTVVDVSQEGDGVSVLLDDGRTVRAAVVVGADGVESSVGRAAGITHPLPIGNIGRAVQYKIKGEGWTPGRAEVYTGGNIVPRGYAWIFPKENGTANVGLGSIGTAERRNMRTLLDEFIGWRSIEGEVLDASAGAVPTTLPPDSAISGRIALVGDAARHSYSVGGGGIH